MITIRKSEVVELYQIELQTNIHIVTDRIAFFEKKYEMPFEKFEKKIVSEDENFENWDNYLEWKAYEKTLKTLKKNFQDIKRENYQITG